jgi:hypothetical protein
VRVFLSAWPDQSCLACCLHPAELGHSLVGVVHCYGDLWVERQVGKLLPSFTQQVERAVAVGVLEGSFPSSLHGQECQSPGARQPPDRLPVCCVQALQHDPPADVASPDDALAQHIGQRFEAPLARLGSQANAGQSDGSCLEPCCVCCDQVDGSVAGPVAVERGEDQTESGSGFCSANSVIGHSLAGSKMRATSLAMTSVSTF